MKKKSCYFILSYEWIFIHENHNIIMFIKIFKAPLT